MIAPARRPFAVLATLSVILAFGTATLRGHAQTAQAEPESNASPLTESLQLCVQEHERGRVFKTELKLFESRDALTRCAAQDCPLAVRADCQNWLSEVEALIPTVLVVFEGDTAHARERARVLVDGRLLEQGADRPIELAPGRHRLRFELAPHTPVEQEVELAPGDKNRVVRARFSTPAPSAPRAETPALPAMRPIVRQSRPVPTVTYVLGATALVSATAAGVLLGSVLIDQERANDDCAPFCSQRVADSLDQRLLYADLTGLTALVFGGLATYSYLTRPTETQVVGQQRVSLAVDGEGGILTFRGAF
jgi:hypothetical protein